MRLKPLLYTFFIRQLKQTAMDTPASALNIAQNQQHYK